MGLLFVTPADPSECRTAAQAKLTSEHRQRVRGLSASPTGAGLQVKEESVTAC